MSLSFIAILALFTFQTPFLPTMTKKAGVLLVKRKIIFKRAFSRPPLKLF